MIYFIISVLVTASNLMIARRWFVYGREVGWAAAHANGVMLPWMTNAERKRIGA